MPLNVHSGRNLPIIRAKLFQLGAYFCILGVNMKGLIAN